MRFPGSRRRHRSGNPNRSSRNALTAAGFRVRGKDTDMMRRLLLPWQPRSFAYYDLLGEIKFAAQFYARMLAPLRLYVEELKDGEWVESENAQAIDALERIKDPGGGGRTGLLGSYGRLMFLTGECFLFVSTDRESGEEQWEMLSTDELRPQGNVYIRYKAPSMAAEEYHAPDGDEYVPEEVEPPPRHGEGYGPGWGALDVDYGDREAVAYRLWQKHPRYSYYADATMEGVLDLCEELVLLTQLVRSRARSRLAGPGILFLSEDFSQAPLEPTPDEDEEEDPFLADLTEAMTKPIVDEGTASAVVPLVVRGPTDAIEKGIKHVQVIDPTQVYPETGLRYECVKRIAIGLDMPPEVLLGLTDANHWTGWMIDEQTWKNHGLPKAVQLCDDLNQSYFMPYLRDQVKLDGWENYRIGFDATTVINHPDRGKDAKDLFDRVALSHEALRNACGFTEDDAPSKEERAERIGILTRDSSLAWDGYPAPRGGAVEVAPGVISSDQPGDIDASPAPAAGGEVEPGPPKGAAGDSTGGPDVVVAALATEALASRIMVAADIALYRAREIAGNRLKGLAKRDPECQRLVEGVRAMAVPAVLGRERARRLRAPSEADLVAGVRDQVHESLSLCGLSPKQVEWVGNLVADQVEQHAARTLYDERPSSMPQTFSEYVARSASARR